LRRARQKKSVEVPVEKIVYRDRVVPVEKIVEVKGVREVPVPVEKVVEVIAFKETFLEVPVERLVYRDRDVLVERVVEQIILQASFAAPQRVYYSQRPTARISHTSIFILDCQATRMLAASLVIWLLSFSLMSSICTWFSLQ
jgi:hypothetical protein